MSATLEEVAKAAGVSVTTASRVLTANKHPVRAATRQRVLKAAQRLQYRPNLLARSMRTERTHTIGILAEDLLSPFTPPIIRGIQDFLKTIDYLALIVNTDSAPEVEQNAISTLLSRSVEGILFVELDHLAGTEELIRSEKPFVFVHRLFGASITNSVVPDDELGTRLALEHLLRLGHQQIAHIAGPLGWHSARRRLEGYRDLLTEHGFALDNRLIVEGDWTYQGGMRAAEQILAATPRPTAIYVANDTMAFGAIHAIQQQGLRVPDDIAIVSYDNSEFSRILHPTLTTVSLPAYEMGLHAAELLWRKLQGEAVDEQEVKICGRLYIRESCGAAEAQRTQDLPDVGTTTRRQITQ
ncbi:MAG: LacI family DNA-binding transcriptional regulator [Caldilineaceae bacterium]|nr:LacI family DNA-binding transcriptional regulator [Caldilineaceae bacterium]